MRQCNFQFIHLYILKAFILTDKHGENDLECGKPLYYRRLHQTIVLKMMMTL